MDKDLDFLIASNPDKTESSLISFVYQRIFLRQQFNIAEYILEIRSVISQSLNNEKYYKIQKNVFVWIFSACIERK